MESLISHSIQLLREGANNMQTTYAWMDVGDVICEKLRSEISLNQGEASIVCNLTSMCNSITLTDTITLYRGTMEIFDPILAGKQLNSMTPNINTARTYGPYITKIIVPKGANAFYISAWEILETRVDAQEEKEVLLLPGKFTILGETNGITTYIYEK